jgi:ribosomal protein S18 acetylase RimI-like enzyme
MIKVIQAQTPEQLSQARELLENYGRAVEGTGCSADMEEELSSLPGDYAPPYGRLLVAYQKDVPVGCVAMYLITPFTCEVKRLFVRPEFRRHGVGRALMNELIKQAQQVGYQKMRLDTHASMVEALALYRNIGFKPAAPYYKTKAEISFLELPLKR